MSWTSTSTGVSNRLAPAHHRTTDPVEAIPGRRARATNGLVVLGTKTSYGRWSPGQHPVSSANLGDTSRNVFALTVPGDHAERDSLAFPFCYCGGSIKLTGTNFFPD